MFQRKYKSIKLFSKDAEFLKDFAHKHQSSIAEFMVSLVAELREGARKQNEDEARMQDFLKQRTDLLIPYLGEPDTMVNGEPVWAGNKYKKAYMQYLRHHDPETYKQYQSDFEKP